MLTLKKINKDRLSITSKILKKDKDYLLISPEFIKDLKDKILLENSALKLSISDYQLMCRNDKVLNMMSIALNKPKAKLKKFCKHMPVFEENISKSSKSIANKINGINGPITNLPIGVRSIILEKFAEILPTKYVLLDWIDKDKLNWMMLSANPNAIDLLKENPDEIDWDFLSRNPNAIDLLETNQDKINWVELCNNPSAIDLIEKQIKYENSLTKEEYNDLYFEDKINWSQLCLNPNAIHLLLKNKAKINWSNLSVNPNAIDLLKERVEYENNLSSKHYNSLGVTKKINWIHLSDNRNPNVINLIKRNLNELDQMSWRILCSNPNAIELIKHTKDKISWKWLSANPNAIDLLKERVVYEKTLTKSQYNNLYFENKIDWEELSLNPNAIDLLKKNQDKIDWGFLSTNPNAIDLLKQRIEYENNLTKTQYNNLKKLDKIDWYYLSSNPNAINLLKGNQDKINWNELSKNPAIFKAV